MSSYKEQFDIFVCGGSAHMRLLKTLLPKLLPFGKVHLGSSFLTNADLAGLHGLYDVLHQPRHSEDGYCNFELFCIRDINRLASAPYFIKLDADALLEPDWIEYVEDGIANHPDAVLFGPRKGNKGITFTLTGTLVERVLEQVIQLSDALKVGGGFYVGKTQFFKQHQRFMDVVHEFMWCFEDGKRIKPSIYPEHWLGVNEQEHEPLTLLGRSETFIGNEDMLRSLVVHAKAAGDRLHILDGGQRVRIVRTNIENPDIVSDLSFSSVGGD